MGERKKPEYAYKPHRCCNNDRQLFRGLAHDRSEDEHADELSYHQHRKDGDVVAGICTESMLHIVNRHSGDEVHASLAEKVEPQEDQERAAPEYAGRLSEALAERRLDRFLLLLPCAEEHGDRANEEEHAEEEHALHILRRIVCLLDDHARDKSADGGSER